MTVNHIVCPNCKYEGKPKYRTSTLAWWVFWFIFGGVCGLIGLVSPLFLAVPVILFIVAVIGTIINSTKGPIFCPRCRFAHVVPQDKK